MDTLTHLEQELKNYGPLPANGLAVFAGVIDGKYTSCAIEPSRRIRSYIYHCGKEFYTEPLEVSEEKTDQIGVIAIDATECAVGIIDGADCQILETLTSGVPGKSGKGGSSSLRYERNRDSALNAYFNRVAIHTNNLLNNRSRLKEIVVAGPGFTKKDFLKTAPLDYRLKKLVTRTLDSAYAGADGVLQVRNRLAKD